MSQAKYRDWMVTVYPFKYEGLDRDVIDSKEADWLHAQSTGPFELPDKATYLFGCMERGKKGGKLHCHYRVYFKNQVRLATIQKVFGKNIKAKKVESPDDYELYIKKEGKFAAKAETHIAGPWTYGDRPAPGSKGSWGEIKELVRKGSSNAVILEEHPFAATQMRAISVLRETFQPLPPLPFETPYAYQKEVIDLCSGPPERRRWIWVHSSEVGTGKSQLGVYLTIQFGALNCSLDRRSVLSLYRPEQHHVLVFDLPRLTHLTEEMLKFFEELSDQKFLVSDKYEPVQKYVCAHLVILSNHSPPINRYGDRIKEIVATPIY